MERDNPLRRQVDNRVHYIKIQLKELNTPGKMKRLEEIIASYREKQLIKPSAYRTLLFSRLRDLRDRIQENTRSAGPTSMVGEGSRRASRGPETRKIPPKRS